MDNLTELKRELQAQVEHTKIIAKTFETEKAMLIQAASIVQSQLEDEPSEDLEEQLLASLTYYNERLEVIDDEYYLACADYWMAQSDLKNIEEHGE